MPLSLAGTLLVAVFAFAVGMARQAERTAVERDRAEQVVAFIVDLLADANPLEAQTDSVLVRDVLERGAARIQDELADQPEIRATLMDVMAQGYYGLGLFEPSRSLHAQVLDLRRSFLPEMHPDLGSSLRRLAKTEVHTGRYEEASPLLVEALDHARRVLEPGSQELASALHEIAFGWQALTEYEHAQQLYEEAIAILRGLPEAAGDMAEVLNDLAPVRRALGDLDSAEIVLRESLALRETRDPDDDVSLALGLASLAGLLAEKEQFSEADSLIRAAIGIYETSLPPDHPRLTGTKTTLARLRHEQGMLGEALALRLEVVAANEASYGAGSVAVGHSSNSLGLLLRDMGQLDEAESALRRALSIYETLFAADHLFVGIALANLGWIVHLDGRSAEAAQILARSAEIERVEQPDHWGTAGTLVNLGIARMAAGDLGPAELALREGVHLSRRLHPEGDDAVLTAENALGEALTRLAKFEEAEALLLGTLELEAGREADDPYRAYTVARLVDLYEAWGKPEKAEALRAIG